jgi:hypothetical protein
MLRATEVNVVNESGFSQTDGTKHGAWKLYNGQRLKIE